MADNIHKFKGGRVFKTTRLSFQDGKRVVIHRGGTGSGKTYDIMQYLFFHILLNPKPGNQIITVVSESRPHLEIGVVRYLLKFATDVGLLNVNTWNKSKLLFTNPFNENVLEFFSADRIEKALGARRDWLFGNEINSLKRDVWDELARRSERIIADFNPTSKFWLEDWLLNYEDVVVYKSNFNDNPFLSETEKARILKRAERDANFRRVHIDCEYGIFEGLVFENWTQIDSFPDGDYKFGLDWGFSNSPTALVRVLETEDSIYADELLYRTGMLNREVIAYMESLGIKKNYDVIIADSAEPKSIEEVSRAGFNILPADKGADSIRKGIDYIRSKNLYVTKRSVNLIRELRNYRWLLDKNGEPTNKPIDAFNHLCDSLRYACITKTFQPQDVRYLENLIY